MESFVYEDLNRVCREKDKSKIKFYGAYAAALSYIINFANNNRVENRLQKSIILYRGVKLTQEEVDRYEPGNKIHLLGYTSTSKELQIAGAFALKDCNNDRLPVVFEIVFKGT